MHIAICQINQNGCCTLPSYLSSFYTNNTFQYILLFSVKHQLNPNRVDQYKLDLLFHNNFLNRVFNQINGCIWEQNIKHIINAFQNNCLQLCDKWLLHWGDICCVFLVFFLSFSSISSYFLYLRDPHIASQT